MFRFKTRLILRYRPTTAFAAAYAAFAPGAAVLALAAAAVLPEATLTVALAAGLFAFAAAAFRAAAGQGIGPVRFVGGIGVPRVLAMRRNRLRHAAAFAVVGAGAMAGLLAGLSRLVPGAVDWPGPVTLTVLLASHAAVALAAIHCAACTTDALRRAFAMARPGI